jgi:putative ABC transport system permease protein
MISATIIARNVRHRPARSLLTIFGVAVGIAAVVTLVGAARGFERGWLKAYELRGTDLVITKVSSRSPMPELFDERMKDDLLRWPGVREAAGAYVDLVSVSDKSNLFVYGWELNSFLWRHLKLREGRWPAGDEERSAVLGEMAAEILGARVGDVVPLDMYELKVCGIFESPAMVENGAMILSLPLLQKATGNPGKIRHINLRLADGCGAAEFASVRAAVKARFPGFQAYTANELMRNNSGLRMVKAMTAVTSTIAVVVGALGVMNTMLMSVFERTQEIGILLAVGWRRRRVMWLILLESVALCGVGGALGSLLGVGGGRLLQQVPQIRGMIDFAWDTRLFAAAMAVAVGVGLLGGLYPAWRGSRLAPAEAMRHE